MKTEIERIAQLEAFYTEHSKKLDELKESLEVLQSKLFNGYFDRKITEKIKATFTDIKMELLTGLEKKIDEEVETRLNALIGKFVVKVVIAGLSSGAFVQFLINYFQK